MPRKDNNNNNKEEQYRSSSSSSSSSKLSKNKNNRRRKTTEKTKTSCNDNQNRSSGSGSGNNQPDPWWVEGGGEHLEPTRRNSGQKTTAPIRIDDDNDDDCAGSVLSSSVYIEGDEPKNRRSHNNNNNNNNNNDPWSAYERKRDQYLYKRESNNHRSNSSSSNVDGDGDGNQQKESISGERTKSKTTTKKKKSSSSSRRNSTSKNYWDCDACTYRNQLIINTSSSPSGRHRPSHATCEICGTIHIFDEENDEDNVVVDMDQNQYPGDGGGGVEQTLASSNHIINADDYHAGHHGGDEENPSWAVTSSLEENNSSSRNKNGKNKSSSTSLMESAAAKMMSSVNSMFRLRNTGGENTAANIGGDADPQNSGSRGSAKSKLLYNKRSGSTATELTVHGSMQDLPSGEDDRKHSNKSRRSSRNSNMNKNSRTGGSSGGSGEDTSESTNESGDRRRSSNRRGPANSATSSSSSSSATATANAVVPQYTVSELVKYLGATDDDVHGLPPALERRVRDFKFARSKRLERHGEQKPWGIYGLYAHLSDIRADLEWAEDAAWRRQQDQPYLSWRDFEDGRDKGLHNRPWFTYTILFLCTIMMIVTLGVNGWVFEPLSVNPLIGPSAETLIKCGARDTNLIVNDGQWFRLFTPMILHAGLVHYILNMLALYFIGGAVEQSHGFASAAVLFIIPAVGGNILSAICLPQYISVGASGGIFGLIGGCLADITLNWNLLFLKTTTDEKSRMRHLMVLLWLGFDIIVNCLLGLTPFVGEQNNCDRIDTEILV